MSASGSKHDDGRPGGGFADLFDGDDETRRIESKERAPAKPKAGRRRAPDRAATPSLAAGDDALDDDTFRGEVPPAEFTDLRMGRIRPAQRIDLHGFDRKGAQQTLQKAFGVATASGHRCVLVIHGKGRSTATGEATLKSALPRWLRTPPLDAAVRGFAPALPRDGGEGATYVLLRRHPATKAKRR